MIYFRRIITVFTVIFSLGLTPHVICDNTLSNLEISDPDLKYLASLKQEINPNTTIFAFDLHEVLFRKKVNKMFSTCCSVLARGMIWYALNPFFWSRVKTIYSQETMWENFFKQIVTEYPNLAKFETDFYEIATSYEPILPMVQILESLKNKGYTIFLLSNIGEETLKRHKTKFSQIMSNFDYFHTPSSKNNFIHKPNPDYYKEFKNLLETAGLSEKQVVFIDDLEENVNAAASFGIACIHFKCIEQFNKILHHLKIL